MAARLERTCWRGIEVDHPCDWEVAVASGADQPGQLTLADRRHHRVDIRWKRLKHLPNLDLMLTKHKRRKETDKTKYSDLKTASAAWRGVVQTSPGQGTIVHAGRFFRATRLLVEVTLVWPDRRDLPLESQILESVITADPQADQKLWQAMGMSVKCPAEFDLYQSELNVGRIKWSFNLAWPSGKAPKPLPSLTIERVAMPDQLLKGEAVRDWLVGQLASSQRCLRQQHVPRCRGGAEELISIGKAAIVDRIRNRRRMQLDLAWRCPIEERLYCLQYTEYRSDEEISLPRGLNVSCCRSVPTVRTMRNVG